MRALVALAVVGFLLLCGQPVRADGTGTTATFAIGSITAPTAPIPVDGSANIVVPWTYTFANPAAAAAAEAAGASPTLTWDQPKCDPSRGLSVVGTLSEVVSLPPASSAETSVKGISPFTVVASANAPGETVIQCTFVGKVSAATSADQPTNSASGSVRLQVAYRGLVTATVPATIQMAGPQKQIVYTIQLQNLGNSASAIDFALVGGARPGWQAVLPAQVILTSPNNGGTDNTATVNFVVSTPYKEGWNNAEQTFQLVIQPQSTKDTSDAGKGQPITVNVLARVRGCYASTPTTSCVETGNGTAASNGSTKSAAAPGLLVPLGVAAAVLVARRRKCT